MSKKGETKIEREVRKKRELAEEVEDLRQTDLPDDVGRKYVVEKIEEGRTLEDNHKSVVMSDLQAKAGYALTYRQKLALYGEGLLDKIEWDEGWEHYCLPTSGQQIRIYGRSFDTKEGILFILRSAKGEVFSQGVLASYNPVVDTHAVEVFVVNAENTLDSDRGILAESYPDGTKRTKGGIILP